LVVLFITKCLIIVCLSIFMSIYCWNSCIFTFMIIWSMLQVITFNNTLGIQRVMHSNVVSPRFVNVVFQILGFAIQKSLAAQFVVRISFVQV
jgi:hypothetical protein